MATDPRRQEQARQWGQAVARAWSDEQFAVHQQLQHPHRGGAGDLGGAAPRGCSTATRMPQLRSRS